MRRGVSAEEIKNITKIDYFYLSAFQRLISLEKEIAQASLENIEPEMMQLIKEKGFGDAYLASVWQVDEKAVRHKRKEMGIIPSYKMVDTCAAEFAASSNYFYSSYFGENEQIPSDKRKVLIIGSGPIRIGQELNLIIVLYKVSLL